MPSLDKTEAVETALGTLHARYDPSVVAIGQVVIGLGLVGLVLLLSPYSITDLMMVFGVPILILLVFFGGIGLSGNGFLSLLASRRLGERLQGYLREYKEAQEAVQAA